MRHWGGNHRAYLMCSAACVSVILASAPAVAHAQAIDFDIPPQSLSAALDTFAAQSRQPILVTPDMTLNKTSPGVSGEIATDMALAQLLSGTGLTYKLSGKTFLIVQEGGSAPQSESAAGDGADGTVEALIVTAQKREEDIQDVPIAISAFTQEDLTRSQVAGGPDLITQVPNMTFTKTNFSSYSVQLRGIGTQAISATTDPAVAVAFNNTPFIRNRFFEQEFYDLQRVEVLRGPQGTLYGRNATAGVVNIISQKPKFIAEAKASGDLSNYNSSRIEGMVNIPLVEDKVALRLAGAWTKRDGYATNELTGNPIDGRDLWSTRVSLRIAPNDRLDANLIWEHFEEDDDRLRSGKQLCKKHVPTVVDGIAVPQEGTSNGSGFGGAQSALSQGCTRISLYSPEAFQTPNGFAVPYYHPLGAIGLPIAGGLFDPYSNKVQSLDLRMIESTVDPDYRAKSDLGELQVSFDLTDTLTLSSETAYAVDFVWSLQDFNRFNTRPGAWGTIASTTNASTQNAILHGILDEDGFFCDPQIGCADRLVAMDIATATARQFSQEFRISSDYSGPFNFSLGANYLRADSKDKYYVFINSLTLFAAIEGANGYEDDNSNGMPYEGGTTDNLTCLRDGPTPGDPNNVFPVEDCVYIDPNPVSSLNDQGHNYFLSNNPYKLISYAVFGEAYYNITDSLKLTAGLRWTVDKKEAPRVPSWTLAGDSYGYPVAEVIEQEWKKPTGRLTLDWKPDLSFTDESLLYASYAHGYKAGGANPPRFVYAFRGGTSKDNAEIAAQNSLTRPKTFDAEFVDAFEVGSKNTLFDGRVTLNLAAFYYDYKDYQISEIVDRSAFNRNFDATVRGIELESDWRPLENLRLGVKGGYQKTRIADGEQAIDLMDRTAGDPDWIVVRPFPTFASSCILPTFLFFHDNRFNRVGNVSGGVKSGCEMAYFEGVDPVTGEEYVANPPQPNSIWQWYDGHVFPNYPGWDPATAPNNGEGITKNLGGNELPNAPNWTATITADYTLPLPNDWLATLHTDLHWQAESYWRIFQDHEYAKLDEYFTMNLAAIFTNEEAGWNVMAYVKNVTDETAITGAFLNSDDTGLTTNVFLTEPRLYGMRVTKNWSGGPLLGSFGGRRDGPPIFEVEIGGQAQRYDVSTEPMRPAFTSALSPTLNIIDAPQTQDLDWGDGREVKLTWRPGAGPWTVWAEARFGKTNKSGRNTATEESAEGSACSAAYAYLCSYFDPDLVNHSETNWSAAAARQKEDHTVVDFAVGREVGFGALSRSTVSGGVRYAEFASTSALEAGAVYDWLITDGWMVPGIAATHTRHAADLQADRSFEGAGPMMSWDASVALLGGQDNGQLMLDWSLSGGVLFGKQKVSVTGSEEVHGVYEVYGFGLYGGSTYPPTNPVQTTPTNIARSQDVTVPTVGASLGLSYQVDAVRIGAGYRWERYSGALDGGFTEAKDADRTIDGPYFKLSVGFGG